MELCISTTRSLNKFIYHAITSYKAQNDDTEDILRFEIKEITPMAYGRFIYETGVAFLKFNASLYDMMKKKNLITVQSEHVVEAFY